jgi:hypothetical protein
MKQFVLRTGYASPKSKFFQEQSGLAVLGRFLSDKKLGDRGQNLGSNASQGSNSSICPFSPIDSGCRVDASTYRLYAHAALHTDALSLVTRRIVVQTNAARLVCPILR